MTKQRKAILDIIQSANIHMTADDIYMAAKHVIPTIAVGTVYRNLGLMVEAGEIKRIVIPNEPDRFDKTVASHEHIICEVCRELSDVFIMDLKEHLERQIGFEISGYDLVLKHICNKCNQK